MAKNYVESMKYFWKFRAELLKSVPESSSEIKTQTNVESPKK